MTETYSEAVDRFTLEYRAIVTDENEFTIQNTGTILRARELDDDIFECTVFSTVNDEPEAVDIIVHDEAGAIEWAEKILRWFTGKSNNSDTVWAS